MIDYLIALSLGVTNVLFMGAFSWFIFTRKINDVVRFWIYWPMVLAVLILTYICEYSLVEKFEPEVLEKCAAYGKVLGKPTKYVLIHGCEIKN